MLTILLTTLLLSPLLFSVSLYAYIHGVGFVDLLILPLTYNCLYWGMRLYLVKPNSKIAVLRQRLRAIAFMYWLKAVLD